MENLDEETVKEIPFVSGLPNIVGTANMKFIMYKIIILKLFDTVHRLFFVRKFSNFCLTFLLYFFLI